jgi:hypothetical protein
MADVVRIQGAETVVIDWNAIAEQLDGVVEFTVLSHASGCGGEGYGGRGVCKSQGVYGMVLQYVTPIPFSCQTDQV